MNFFQTHKHCNTFFSCYINCSSCFDNMLTSKLIMLTSTICFYTDFYITCVFYETDMNLLGIPLMKNSILIGFCHYLKI